MLTHHSRNGSQAQQQLQQQQLQQQQHVEIQKKHAKAERVRKLWTEFEQWLKHPRDEMERTRAHFLLQAANPNSNTVKTSRRRIEEAHFSKAREEWQRRLRAADLKESDWEPMNETEMKAVEEALGVDDGEGYITDPSPSPPHRPLYAAPSASSTPFTTTTPLAPADNPANRISSSLIPGPPMLLAPPMTSASRATSASSSSYECVKPEEFHSDDEDGSASDSEFSFSTTISSIISEEDEAVGPVTEYIFTKALESELRPSMEGTKENNGPLLARNVPVPKAVDAGASSQPPPSLAPPKRPPDARQQPQATAASRSSSSSSSASVSKKPSPPAPATSTKPTPAAAPTTTKSSPPVASTSSVASSSSSKSHQQPSKSSRVNYPLVAPSLSDLSDYDEVENDAESDRLSPSLVTQFEAQFEARKLEIRIEKIQEFHRLASEGDVALSISIADGRRDRTLSRQGEADLVQKHYESTVALRDRMEKERKEQVNEEKKRLREEYVWRSSGSNQRQHHGLLQQQRSQPPVESDSEDDQEAEQKMWERMIQEQLALQAQFSSHETQKLQETRKRPGTLPLDSMPTPDVAMNDKNLDEVSTPRAAPKGGWTSVKAPAARSLLGQSLSRKPEPVVQQQQSFQEAENEELEADHEEADNENERENTGFWSYLTSGSKKKATNAAPVPQSPQSPWNFASPITKSPQKPTNTRSRLGIVTSAWDDNFAEGREAVEEVVEVEKEELPQEKTPVIPLAPAPNVSPANKKQTKKQQRQANKKGGAASAGSSAGTAAAKAEKAEAPPAPASASSSSTLKGSKTAPVGVPGKSGKKTLDSDDFSSTPRPSALKRLQAQLANEEMFNEQEVETPTTPRPPAVKKAAAAHPPNPWARKNMNKTVIDPAFDDGVAVDSTPGATSSRTTLDPVNGKKMTEPIALSPQAPGAWSWAANDKVKAPAEAPSTTTATGPRKNSGPARQPAVSGVDNTKKGKKAQRGANANGNTTNSASNSAWSIKKTTVEEIPDDEADDFHPGSQTDKLLPHNSRSIIEEMRDSPFDFEEQPKIHEPRPSKPRAVFENIFQYGEPTPDLVHDLQDGLSWSEERIAQAVARMAQESAEMDRKMNGLNGPNGVNGTNGYTPSSGPIGNGAAGMGMNGGGHVNTANMNRVNMTSMNGSVTAVNGFGLSKSTGAAVDGTTTTTKKQVRWQQQQPQPSGLGGFDDLPRSQPLPSQAFVNKMATVPRSYEDDEAFSPLASTNGGFSGFQSSSSSSSSAASSYAPFGGRNTKMTGLSQFGGLSGNHHPFSDVETDNELDRAARSLLENIHVSVSSQQRNKPFSAV